MKIETYYKILDYIKEVIKNKEFEGHVYSVGGCERDKHIGLQEIKDIDLVVDLPNNSGIRFARWLHSMGLVRNGNIIVYENFGTAMFRLSAFPDEEIEVVHTRKEIYRDKNSRNPETDFGTIYDDCFRRDFTINSLYHNISTGEDLDLTGLGLTDLESGIIRTCDNPNIIFSDDSLRIMRAVRFSAKLGFKIADEVYDGMKSNIERLKIISQERITDEFNKILTSKDPYLGLTYLDSIGFFDVITPYLFTNIKGEKNFKSKYDAFNSVKRLKELYNDYNLESALGCFLNYFFIGEEKSKKFLNDFKYSNEFSRAVGLYAKESWHLELACAWDLPEKVREIIHKCRSSKEFMDIVAVSKSCNCLNKVERGIFSVLDNIDIEEMIGYKLPVNGDDVMSILGISPCPKIKRILDYLMGKAYESPKITREECINIIKNLNFENNE